jgi:thiol:disulfide interchange protein DsbC
MASAAFAQCPSKEKISTGLQKITQRNVNVLNAKQSVLSGICEIHASVEGRNVVAYTDPTGNYFLMGQIIDVAGEKNLTQAAMQELDRFTPEEMSQLDALVAFTAGSGDKTVYYVSDPGCPFCDKAEQVLKEMIDQNKLTVKVLLYPLLPMHKEAEPQSIAIICDNKGMEGLIQNYNSENQCDEGRKKVDGTIEFMKKKGIQGTPAYIFPDGTRQMGVMDAKALMQRLDQGNKSEEKSNEASKAAPKKK